MSGGGGGRRIAQLEGNEGKRNSAADIKKTGPLNSKIRLWDTLSGLQPGYYRIRPGSNPCKKSKPS